MNSQIAKSMDNLRALVTANPLLAPLNLLERARPSIRLTTRGVAAESIERGASRIGGVPDVPPGFQWPHWNRSKPQENSFGGPPLPTGPLPLAFIAQLDLSTVPVVDDALPHSGWLYFFYDRYEEPWGFDPADRGCCRVLYVKGERSTLQRAELPDDLPAMHVANHCLVEAWPELTLPDEIPELEYGTAEYEAYWQLRNGLDEKGSAIRHRLLGLPQTIQNPMEMECQLASHGIYCGSASHFQQEEVAALETGVVNWRLLLQIDTDEEEAGWMWGDCGRIYFWIEQQKLAAGNFEDVWLILQCS